MSIVICVATALTVLVSVLGAKKNPTIQGHLDVKPVVDRVEAVLELRRGGDPVRTVEVQPRRPYRFKGEVPAPSDDHYVTVYVLVEGPDEYVAWEESFEKDPCCILDIKPRIRRRRDLYDTLKTRGEELLESDKARSRKYLERAADLAKTIGQKELTQRHLARMDFAISGCESFTAAECDRTLALKSSRRLANLFKQSGFLSLGEERLLAYWQERLDYLLWQTNFYSQAKPEETFAGFIAAQPLYRRLWLAILADYRKSYPEQALTEGNDVEAIKAQLSDIQSNVW